MLLILLKSPDLCLRLPAGNLLTPFQTLALQVNYLATRVIWNYMELQEMEGRSEGLHGRCGGGGRSGGQGKQEGAERCWGMPLGIFRPPYSMQRVLGSPHESGHGLCRWRGRPKRRDGRRSERPALQHTGRGAIPQPRQRTC